MKNSSVRRAQSRSFENADGIIFLTNYARDVVLSAVKLKSAKTILIPHGISRRFQQKPKPQKPISVFSFEAPLRLLYVSHIAPYKHQWKVIEAVWSLRSIGMPLYLTFAGGMSYGKREFETAIVARTRLDNVK